MRGFKIIQDSLDRFNENTSRFLDRVPNTKALRDCLDHINRYLKLSADKFGKTNQNAEKLENSVWADVSASKYSEARKAAHALESHVMALSTRRFVLEKGREDSLALRDKASTKGEEYRASLEQEVRKWSMYSWILYGVGWGVQLFAQLLGDGKANAFETG